MKYRYLVDASNLRNLYAQLTRAFGGIIILEKEITNREKNSTILSQIETQQKFVHEPSEEYPVSPPKITRT